MSIQCFVYINMFDGGMWMPTLLSFVYRFSIVCPRDLNSVDKR